MHAERQTDVEVHEVRRVCVEGGGYQMIPSNWYAASISFPGSSVPATTKLRPVYITVISVNAYVVLMISWV
eukprot:COSAG05_NODE_1119_length_5816_cov_7.262375_4_plen_71_part_00